MRVIRDSTISYDLEIKLNQKIEESLITHACLEASIKLRVFH